VQSSQPFVLSPTLDVASLREEFTRKGRLEIASFLAGPGADLLADHLLEREDWRLVLNAGPKVFEMDRAGQAALTQDQRAALEKMVANAARSGFQYKFETVRVPDEPSERKKINGFLERFALFLSSKPVLDILSHIVGADDIAFADAQATSYGPGHFLTRHDDDVEGKGRRAAYVLGLTPAWEAEWGGLLMFHGLDGRVEEIFAPAWNSLKLFRVPSLHSVSYVTPWAPEPRLSVTGWLRTGHPQAGKA
jgi:SM-20-related protein